MRICLAIFRAMRYVLGACQHETCAPALMYTYGQPSQNNTKMRFEVKQRPTAPPTKTFFKTTDRYAYVQRFLHQFNMFWVRESIKHFTWLLCTRMATRHVKLGQTSRMPQKCRRQQPGPAQNKIVGSVNDTDCSTHNNFELHMLSTSKVSFYGFRYAIIT